MATASPFSNPVHRNSACDDLGPDGCYSLPSRTALQLCTLCIPNSPILYFRQSITRVRRRSGAPPETRRKMSSSSQDYYHSSRPTRDDRSLPSIRDVVGEELDGRARASPYTFGDVRGALPGSHHPPSSRTNDHRGPTLPPIRQSTHSSSRVTGYPDSQGRYPSGASHAHHHSPSASHRVRGHEDSGHIYGVLRPSATAAGDLIHATPPADRPHGILRQSSTSHTYDMDPDRRHRCDYCGKGFDRPSSLEVHLRTHTGSQPFACEWPGCHRTFSVRSNMLRHWRSHEKNSGSSQNHGGDDYHYDSDPREEPSSSRYFHAPSSTQPSSSHYHSSRRK